LHVLGLRVHAFDLARPLWVVAAVGAAAVIVASRRWMRYASAAGSALSIALALVALARRADPMPPVGDIGVIEIYIFDALKGRLFLGPYSRFLWHHPGPIYFYMLAPFYALSGYLTTGAAAGALAINIASVALIAWTSRRAGARPVAMLLTGVCVLYAIRFGRLFTSQWNPHVLVLPMMAFMVVAAAVASGAIGLIPILFGLASFAVQTHLGLAPSVAAVGACALAVALWQSRHAPPARRRFWWQVNAALWVAAALWFLPIVEALTSPTGNLTRLWRFFAGSASSGQTPAVALAAWSAATSGAVRSGFDLAWGGQLDPAVQIAPTAIACALAAALAWAAASAFRAGRRFHAALAGLLVVASAAALWSAAHIAGDIVDHEVFWMSGLGALAMAAIVAEAAEVLAPQAVRARAAWRSGTRADLLIVVLIALFIWRGAVDLRRRVDESRRPGDEEVAATTLFEEIAKYDRTEGTPRVRIDIDGPAWDVAAGVLVELERAGVPFGVMPGASWMFGSGTSADGSETRTILISSYAAHDAAIGKGGAVPLAERRGFFADVTAGR
jgi:hypothetical protein